MTANAGCVKAGDRFRPLVFVSHEGVYFSGNLYETAEEAVSYAQDKIDRDEFRKWHHHVIETDH